MAKKMQIGDFVKGKPESDDEYGITNSKMTRGLIVGIDEGSITVKVLEHTDGGSGKHQVKPKYFEVIGHVKPFNRADVLELLKNGRKKAILDYNLSGADLSGADLSGADLSGADLSEANLSGANLSEANLREANLSGADLSGADLREANLREADLREANLSEADLSGADLSEADLREANLSEADLSGADLSEANLSGADLSGADLSEANLSGADLSGADLSGADLREANLSGADLSGADLSGANLSGANLDFSCLPLRCGGLKWHIDKRIACQLAYHLCSMQCDDAEYIKMRNSLLPFANQFHRVKECGKLELIEEKEDQK